MHEMALSLSLLDLIADEQRANGFSAVRRVVVELGELGHVDPHALRFAFEAARTGTSAAQAALEIQEVGGRAWCVDCRSTVEVAQRGAGCPSCGGHALLLEAGEELRLKTLEVV
jgi:hydrogenase nickel incorporation protein HypA/HybF